MIKTINRREFRQKLGTRRGRREGTKSKAIPKAKTSGRGKADRPTRTQCYRHFRRQRPRPAVLLEALIRRARAEASSVEQATATA